MILITERKRRTSVTLTIAVERHHVTGSSYMFILLVGTLLLIIAINSAAIRRTICEPTFGAIVASCVLSLSVAGGEVASENADGICGASELWHGGLVFDVGGLVVEGAEAEHALEELPSADQVADADGNGGFTDIPQLIDGCHGGGEVEVPGYC